MKKTLFLTALALAIGTIGGLPGTYSEVNAASNSYKTNSASKKQIKPARFSAAKKRVMDTCKGGDTNCITQLKASCDKAGGGLSTEPDGGVDCFVVGIHDQ